MSAIGKIMEELYTVRRQVLSVRDDDVKFGYCITLNLPQKTKAQQGAGP